jgi:hypothetical protein
LKERIMSMTTAQIAQNHPSPEAVRQAIQESTRLANEGLARRAQAARDETARIALLPPKPVVPTFHETAAAVAHLVDQSLPAKAREDYGVVCQRQADVATLTREAEKTLSAAMSQRQALALAAAKGEIVKPQTAADAERAVRDAEANLQHLHSTATALGDVHRQAHDALMAAQGLAYVPVLEHGVELRIAAGAKLDAARAVMAEAERDWTVATDTIVHAVNQGARWPARVGLGGNHVVREPGTEAGERAFWRKTV